MSETNTETTTFDSTYFVSFGLMHKALKAGLKAASSLSVTQYRILVKLMTGYPQAVNQSDLVKLLHFKPNVVTQSLDTLEKQGYVRRERSGGDGRMRAIRITDTGIEHIARVNESIVAELYDRFPTQSQTFRQILEASIIAGATIDPPLSAQTPQPFPASLTLVSFELISQTIAEGLREACGASFDECRIMQRLDEEGIPLRISDLAKRLHMGVAHVARTTDRLVERGWVQRMGIPSDKKAVFVVVTNEGAQQQAVITCTIAELAQRHLWDKLSPEHRQAISRVGSTVFADIQAKKEAEHKVMLSLLKPL